jgi:methanogen extracellular protein (TIGR04279 family)
MPFAIAVVKVMVICLCLLCAGAAAALDHSYSNDTSLNADGNWIELQGENSIKLPMVSLSRASVNWTYPIASHPVYHESQMINATFFGSRDLANETIEVFVDDLAYSSFMRAVDVLDGPANFTATFGTFGPYRLNSTGDASFSLQGMAAGIYSIYVAFENSSWPLSASPLLVTETDMEVSTPPVTSAGDLLAVKVKLDDGYDGRPLTYGTFIVSAEDYRALTFNITGDGSRPGTVVNLRWNEEALSILGDSDIGWDLLARMLMIFPRDSAAALQDSVDGEVTLYMITEDDWAPGAYILTSIVLSQEGVVGLNQTEVMIV